MSKILPFPAPPGMRQEGASQVNPMRMITDQFMRGFSPAAIVDRIGGPQARQAREIISGKSEDQLREIATNMAAQRGVDLDRLANQLGVRLPK